MFDGKGYPKLKCNEVFNTTTGKLDSNAMVAEGEYPFFTCAKEIFRIDKFAFDQEALLLAGNNAAGKYDVKYYKGKFNAYQRTYVLGLKQNWSYQLFRYQLEDKLDYLQQQSLGGLTKYLTIKILGELEFIVPSMDKQNEFTAFVEQVDKSKFEIQKSLEKLEILKKSLMQQYFG
jgi:restriction endonuclease S subunit